MAKKRSKFLDFYTAKAKALPFKWGNLPYRERENLRSAVYSFLRRKGILDLFEVTAKGEEVTISIARGFLKQSRHADDQEFLESLLEKGTVDEVCSFYLFEQERKIRRETE